MDIEGTKKKLEKLKKDAEVFEIEKQEIKENLSFLDKREEKIKTQKEYVSLSNEKSSSVEALKKVKVKQSMLSAKIIDKENQLVKLKSDSQKYEKNLKPKLLDIDEMKDSIVKEIKNIEKENLSILNSLDPQILNQFKFIIKSKKDFAVAPIMDDICQGCNIEVSSTIIFRVLKLEDFVFCNNCSRILYIPESLAN